MNLRTISCKAALITAFVPIPTLAQSAQLDLNPGTYVDARYKCGGAPNAALLTWDGKGFSGAHSSDCSTRVLSRQGDTFRIQTICAALGDGTPAVAVPSDEESLSLQGGSGFILTGFSRESNSYRLCTEELRPERSRAKQ
jgi:hypothetical protein